MSPRRAGLPRRAALAAVGVGVAVSLPLATASPALAYTTRNYSWNCGSSRGVTLSVFVADDRPAQYLAISDDNVESGGPVPVGRPVSIPMPAGAGVVSVLVAGPHGVVDRRSGVRCDRSP